MFSRVNASLRIWLLAIFSAPNSRTCHGDVARNIDSFGATRSFDAIKISSAIPSQKSFLARVILARTFSPGSAFHRKTFRPSGSVPKPCPPWTNFSIPTSSNRTTFFRIQELISTDEGCRRIPATRVLSLLLNSRSYMLVLHTDSLPTYPSLYIADTY